jgi:carbon monoxide dehydrogenase subunit G
VQIEGQFEVAAAAPAALMAHLLDASLMAFCIPGCETLERLSDERYRCVVAVALAGVKARFDLLAEVTRRDESHIWSATRGEEGGRASTLQADTVLTLTATPAGTQVGYRSEVNITGRLGRFALGMMKKKAQSMGDEFAANLRQRLQQLQSEAAPAAVVPVALPPAAPEPTPAPPAVAITAAPWWQRLWRSHTA